MGYGILPILIIGLCFQSCIVYSLDDSTAYMRHESEPFSRLTAQLTNLTNEDSTTKTSLLSDSCKRHECAVWARISITQQLMLLYIEGDLTDSFLVSTGIPNHETPIMERHPSGPTYRKYTSKKYPEGNYMGLGNMPYAVFIRGGYAIHGTTLGNARKLGKKASHGCIRLHPVHGKVFFDLVRKFGLQNTWITIEK